MQRTRSLLALGVVLFACDSSPPRDTGPPRRVDGSVGMDVGPNDGSPPPTDGDIIDAEVADAGVEDSGGGMDAGPQMTIPDPGTNMDDWGFAVNDVCCSTPSTAYPTGIVTMNSGYVQGNIDPATLDFFYVFKAGPALTSFTFTSGVQLTMLDLHDGAGLVFGAVIPPTNMTGLSGTWNVMPDHIYVLHLHSTTSGFF